MSNCVAKIYLSAAMWTRTVAGLNLLICSYVDQNSGKLTVRLFFWLSTITAWKDAFGAGNNLPGRKGADRILSQLYTKAYRAPPQASVGSRLPAFQMSFPAMVTIFKLKPAI